MHSNSPFKKYFFSTLSLFLIFLGVFLYFFYSQKDKVGFWEILVLTSISFFLNIFTIINLKFKKKRKPWALIIYAVLFISSLQEFFVLDIGIAYLFLSMVLLLLLDISPMSSSFKYFNIGMLTTIASFFYFPIGIMILLFLLVTVLHYDEKINISQYLAGILVTIILVLEITYLTDNFPYLMKWTENLSIPKFHFEYQIPILIILIFILVYGWINQYSNSNISDDVEISSKHSIMVLYLLFWIIIYAFFMGNNYELLVFVSLPVSIIISRSI